MNIGQRIVAARKNAGIAQFELAEIANIRYNTIARNRKRNTGAKT